MIDVRKNKFYQNQDVDFIYNDKKIEVKLDTVAEKTHNFAYEVISHGSLGWASITKANYIFIVTTVNDKPFKYYWIDMDKWKNYCADRKSDKRLNTIDNEQIVDILCPIGSLISAGVIISSKEIKKFGGTT